MSNLTILNSSIRTIDNLYSLNDLHKISGSEHKHRPSLFIRLDTTQELIAELNKDFKSTDLIFKTTGGRGLRGTYACEELALAYATWISPKFHLVVLRAFIAMHKGEVQNTQPKLPLAKPKPEVTVTLSLDDLCDIAWAVYSAKRQNALINDLRKPLSAIGSRFATEADDYGREYKRCWEMAFPAIQSIFKQINADQYADEIGWQRIIRHFKPAQTHLQVKRYGSLVDF